MQALGIPIEADPFTKYSLAFGLTLQVRQMSPTSSEKEPRITRKETY